MSIRRIVTATNTAGKAVVISDTASPRELALRHFPGFVSSPIWMTDGVPDLSADGTDPMAASGSLLAPRGGATFLVITFPPDAVAANPAFDPQKAGAEHLLAAPGIAETFETDAPGMHRTPTLDYVTVVKGPIVLELDDSRTVTLNSGDTVVQQGVRHAWRNPYDEPAIVSFVMIAATHA